MSLATLARFPNHVQPRRGGAPRARLAPAANADAAPSPARPDVIEMLTRYIPTETITLYVGAMAALQPITGALRLPTAGGANAWLVYAAFALLTPAVLFVLALRSHRENRGNEPFPPWWRLFASFVAFLVWATSVPGHPLAQEFTGFPAFAALLVSILLSLLDPIFLPAAAGERPAGAARHH